MDLESRLKKNSSVESKKGSGYIKFGSKMSEMDLGIEARFSDIDKKSDGNAIGAAEGKRNVNTKALDSSDNNGLLIFNRKMSGGVDAVDVCNNAFQRAHIQSVVDDKGSTTDAFEKKFDEVPDSLAVSTDATDLKRKRDCASGILNWIKMVAKNPYNPIFGPIPDICKWKFFTTHHILNKIRLLRQAMVFKMNMDSNYQYFNLQKKQKMHPTIYADHIVSEKLRYSRRIRAMKKKTIMQSSSSTTEISCDDDEDSENDFPNVPRQRKVLIGDNFQVHVNDWIGKTRYEADPKWLGTRNWPYNDWIDKTPYEGDPKGLGTRNWPYLRTGKSSIEMEPTGKGRSDSCRCSNQGSIECVIYHVFEKSARLMLELGPVYFEWKFDKMGEYDAILWKKTDEQMFYDTVKSNPFYLGGFWDEIIKVLPNKGKKSLLNFYFNAFILRRRGYQNRFTPQDINSDDDDDDEPDDWSDTVTQPGSIFLLTKEIEEKNISDS